jgi:hypothetical protein
LLTKHQQIDDALRPIPSGRFFARLKAADGSLTGSYQTYKIVPELEKLIAPPRRRGQSLPLPGKKPASVRRKREPGDQPRKADCAKPLTRSRVFGGANARL